MKDTNLTIPKNDLEIIIAKFYHLKDVEVVLVKTQTGETVPFLSTVVVSANYPKKRRKK